jgi:hypothetical protein
MGVNMAEPRQTYIQSSAEPELRPVVVVVWRGRSEKAEGAIGRKSSSSHIYWEAFRKSRMKKSVRMSRRGKGLAVRRAGHL